MLGTNGSQLATGYQKCCFWLVGFGLSLPILDSENFSGKKPQTEINSERTEQTSALLTYIKEYGQAQITKKWTNN